MIKYSEQVGRPAPHSWPEFETLKPPKGGGDMRWHRHVLRFPAEVSADMPEPSSSVTGEAGARQLRLSGKAGSLVLDLEALDPTGLVAFHFLRLPPTGGGPATPPSPVVAAGKPQAPAGSKAAAGTKVAAPAAGAEVAASRGVLLLASHNQELVAAVAEQVESHVRGASQGFLVGLTVKGVGYRLEPVETPVAKAKWYFEAAPAAPSTDSKSAVTPIVYPFPRPVHAIRLKVGYSRTAIFPLPLHVRAFFVKPTLMYLYGLRLAELEELAGRIRAVRKPNPYTGNGVQLVGEVIKLKARKSAK